MGPLAPTDRNLKGPRFLCDRISSFNGGSLSYTSLLVHMSIHHPKPNLYRESIDTFVALNLYFSPGPGDPLALHALEIPPTHSVK